MPRGEAGLPQQFAKLLSKASQRQAWAEHTAWEVDRIIKEVEGHDIEFDHGDRNAVARQTLDHELEFKLLLFSTFKGWSVAANPLDHYVARKNPEERSWVVLRIGECTEFLLGDWEQRRRIGDRTGHAGIMGNF